MKAGRACLKMHCFATSELNHLRDSRLSNVSEHIASKHALTTIRCVRSEYTGMR